MSKVLRASTARIDINRGDSMSVPLEISYPDGSQFIPDSEKGEAVTFAVRKGPKSEENPIIIQKNVTGTRIEIEPADTREMEYGSYIFDVEAVWLDEEELKVKTVIVGQLNVLVEVT